MSSAPNIPPGGDENAPSKVCNYCGHTNPPTCPTCKPNGEFCVWCWYYGPRPAEQVSGETVRQALWQIAPHERIALVIADLPPQQAEAALVKGAELFLRNYETGLGASDEELAHQYGVSISKPPDETLAAQWQATQRPGQVLPLRPDESQQTLPVEARIDGLLAELSPEQAAAELARAVGRLAKRRRVAVDHDLADAFGVSTSEPPADGPPADAVAWQRGADQEGTA